MCLWDDFKKWIIGLFLFFIFTFISRLICVTVKDNVAFLQQKKKKKVNNKAFKTSTFKHIKIFKTDAKQHDGS